MKINPKRHRENYAKKAGHQDGQQDGKVDFLTPRSGRTLSPRPPRSPPPGPPSLGGGPGGEGTRGRDRKCTAPPGNQKSTLPSCWPSWCPSFLHRFLDAFLDRFSIPTWLPKYIQIVHKSMSRSIPSWTPFFNRILLDVYFLFEPADYEKSSPRCSQSTIFEKSPVHVNIDF